MLPTGAYSARSNGCPVETVGKRRETRKELSGATSGPTSDFRIGNTTGASPDRPETALLPRAQQSEALRWILSGPQAPAASHLICRTGAACRQG